jgi:hypothetical protein
MPIRRKNKRLIRNLPVKRAFTNLAQLKEIRYVTTEGKNRIIKFDRRWELLWEPIEKILYVVPKKPLIKIKDFNEESVKHTPAYKMIHTFKAQPFKNAYYLDLVKKKAFNKIGKGIHVVYKSDKWNEGDFWNYIHEYGEGIDHVVIHNHGVNVYYDPINKIYKMYGGKLDVTERGIIH